MKLALAKLAFAVLLTFAAASISTAQPSPPAALPPALTAAPQLPSQVAILAMVRSTLIAVDQGNKTGNYTVLRDLASPSFRDANDPSKLSLIFNPLVSQGIDMLPVTVVEPEYKAPPSITPEKMLYVMGSFPILPKPVNFEILYQMHQGRWRIYGILIAPASSETKPPQQ